MGYLFASDITNSLGCFQIIENNPNGAYVAFLVVVFHRKYVMNPLKSQYPKVISERNCLKKEDGFGGTMNRNQAF